MRFWLFIALAHVSACAGELADPERFAGTFADAAPDCDDVEADVFAVTCAGSVCHDADEPAGGLDLITPGAGARMVGVVSTCGDTPLIDPADVGASYLLDKLGPAPTCGDSMPLAGTPLSAAQVACVRAWAEEQL